MSSEAAESSEILIRSADPSKAFDWDALAGLLSRRDGRPYSIAETAGTLWDLNPAHCHAWLALAGPRAVGLSTVFMRCLSTPGTEFPVGYWANLFVDPDFRNPLLYPRMVMATTQGIRKLGTQGLIAGVRRPDLSAAHQRLGFKRLETFPVLAKPLRPLRVATRYIKMPSPLVTFAGVIDYLPARAMTLAPSSCPRWASVTSGFPLPKNLLALFTQEHSGLSFLRNMPWLEARLSRWKGMGPYTAVWFELDGAPVAAALLACATRGNGYQIGVILDLVAPSRSLEQALLKSIAWGACRRGDDLILWVPSGPDQKEFALSQGYRPTSERYDILVHPPALMGPVGSPYKGNWRFTFLDHDAF